MLPVFDKQTCKSTKASKSLTISIFAENFNEQANI